MFDTKTTRGSNAYGSGGRSGPSAHLRAAGSRSGSSLQLVQTYRGGRSEASSDIAFIGLPHVGHAFRIGWSMAIYFSPAMAL
ncbi:hypothetical protein [Bradyrhizobium sp. WSM471]|jgi:hypothetical protein|uniref:hypothetical protein n=1 Tax=Bradyrhizobium TaxID=374 RepID=UPI00024D19B2|nr:MULTISPECIES: hypothetical protein [Bradyrhizobium]EHR00297.1 hypothetical protein Bra471DRAFT_00867 [Bradyrhizobium sp. WSM471]UFW42411.1 hypothetical protein BcanWSM471_04215 [Bradyrhizobium canariense]